MDKKWTDYINELLDFLPSLVALGMSLQDAVAWVKARMNGQPIMDADWDKLHFDHAVLRGRLETALKRLHEAEAQNPPAA